MAQDDEIIVSHISNFRPVKRIADVIKIFEIICREKKAKLIMIGEGPDKQMAEDMVYNMGIQDKVLFVGQSNEVDKILCFSDLFLLPSEKESFGLAALEAMVNSVPVISTNTGGLPEVNEHGVSGYLSDVGNIEEMGRNALAILETETTLNKFKKGARERAAVYDIHKVVPIYEKLYLQALSKIKRSVKT